MGNIFVTAKWITADFYSMASFEKYQPTCIKDS
jgi:hypothetical protein